MKAVSPHLYFTGNTEEAFEFYQTVFGGELQIVRYGDFPDNPMGVPEEDMDKIGHVGLPLTDGSVLMGTDTLESLGQELDIGNNFSITLETDTAEGAEELFDKLSAGGEVLMPLADAEWAEKYGMCTDKFGVQWQFNYTGDARFSAGPEGGS